MGKNRYFRVMGEKSWAREKSRKVEGVRRKIADRIVVKRWRKKELKWGKRGKK